MNDPTIFFIRDMCLIYGSVNIVIAKTLIGRPERYRSRPIVSAHDGRSLTTYYNQGHTSDSSSQTSPHIYNENVNEPQRERGGSSVYVEGGS